MHVTQIWATQSIHIDSNVLLENGKLHMTDIIVETTGLLYWIVLVYFGNEAGLTCLKTLYHVKNHLCDIKNMLKTWGF